MNIRHKLRPSESLDPELKFRELFLGNCHGIGLSARGPKDPHIILTLLNEDDGHWFVSRNGCFSSFWAPELEELMTRVNTWLTHEEPDVDDQGRQWGWRFKTRKRKTRA